MYYPCSENKVRGYREADLPLCFRVYKSRFSHNAVHIIIMGMRLVRVSALEIVATCFQDGVQYGCKPVQFSIFMFLLVFLMQILLLNIVHFGGQFGFNRQ